MSDAGDRWELGSLFHQFFPDPALGPAGPRPWEREGEARLYGSGRGALLHLCQHLRVRRAHLPSYLCREMAGSLSAGGVEVRFYSDRPTDPAPTATGALEGLACEAGELVVLVDLFGLRRAEDLAWTPPPGVHTVSDHTHGPTSSAAFGSSSHYAFASLRKLWPLPDGGVLWSPAGRSLPPPLEVTRALRSASGQKARGMEEKSRYLAGDLDAEKEHFRRLLDAGETRLFEGDPSGMSPEAREVLRSFPAADEPRRRRSNFEAFLEAVGEAEGLRVLRPAGEDGVPFSALVVFEEEGARDRVQQGLIAERIYASSLWPLSEGGAGVEAEDLRLSRSSFSLPTDLRYGPEDLARAGRVLRLLV